MFRTYTPRPDSTQAIRVTRDNYSQVAAWLATNIAADQVVDIIAPDTQGLGRPRLAFTASAPLPYIRPRTVVPIPGVLTADRYEDGVMYQGHSVDEFDAQWVPANDT